MDKEMMEKMRLAMEQLAKKRAAAVASMREVTKDPMKYQKEFLMKVIQDNKDTEYGRKYDFASIKTIEDFQAKVPLSTYDDYAPYIERMTKNGERNLITAYPIYFYNKSSGTVGIPKKIPMTVPGVEVFQRYAADYQSGLTTELVGADKVRGRSISLVQATETETLPDGIEFGALSDYYMKQALPVWDKQFVIPAEAAFAKSGTNIRYIQGRYSLAAEDPVSMMASFSSFAAEYFRYIEHNWELLVKDIEEGTIDSSIEMPDEVRDQLLQKTRPMPERAARLREIFSQGFDEPFAPKVWPRLVTFSSAMTGSFKSYGELVRDRYLGPDIQIFCRGVGASEGCFSVTTEMNSYDSVLVPDSVFYEFAEEKDGDVDLDHIVTIDQLEKGKKYELIITNLNGYYRYRMRDIFLITGMYQQTPTIEFMYRSDKTVSIMGEKTTEIALLETAKNATKAVGAELINSTVYPDYDNTRYVFLMEIEKVPTDLNEDEIRLAIEKALAHANPSMGDKVEKGICQPTDVHFMQSEAFLLWRDLAVMRGASPGQQKPVTVISNEAQRKFFFSQTEDFEEVKRIFGTHR
jgi:hypothetical protein